MATYLPNVTDTIPQHRPFRPDWQSINYDIELKTQQYKQGFERVNNVYSTLLNSPMLRDSDIKRRDQFFKDAQDTLNKVAGLDLSMPDNVQAAYQIFQPLINDKNITSDMAWTKNFMSERNRMESLRNADRSKNPGYWQDGEVDLGNQANDYSKTNDAEALVFPQARYTPYVDMNKEVLDNLKDMKFKIQGAYRGSGMMGGYIVTTTNGGAMVPPLYQYLDGVYGQDPRYQEMMGVLARNARHSWVGQNAHLYGNDEKAAEDAYFALKHREIESTQRAHMKALGYSKKAIDSTIATLEDNFKTNVAPTNSDNPVVKQYLDYINQRTAVDNATKTTSDILVNTTDMFTADRVARRRAIDAGVAKGMLSQNLAGIAQSYAMLTSEIDLKEDWVARNAIEFEQRKYLENLKASHNLQLLMTKLDLTDPNYEYMLPATGKGVGAAATVDQTVTDQALVRTNTASLEDSQFRLLNDTYDYFVSIYRDTKQPKERRDNALHQLERFFPPEALKQAGYQPGGLAESDYFTYKGVYTPGKTQGFHTIPTYYNALKKVLESGEFRALGFDALIDNAQPVMQDANIKQQIRDSNAERLRKSNLNMLKYIAAHHKDDYPGIRTLFDNGRLKSPALFEDKELYNDLLEKYAEVVNSSPPGIYTPPGGGSPGGKWAGSMRQDINPKVRGDAQRILAEMSHLVNAEDLNYSVGIGQTDKEDYSTDPNLPLIVKTFLNEYMTQTRKSFKGTPDAIGQLYASSIDKNNPEISSVTIVPHQDWLAARSKKIGAVNVDWTKYNQGITIYMPAHQAPSLFQNFRKGPIAQMIANGDVVSINQYKDAGDFSLRQVDGGFKAIWNRHYFDEQGNPQIDPETRNFSNDFDPDVLYQAMLQRLPKIDKDNRILKKLSPHNQGDIEDLEQWYLETLMSNGE